VDPPRGVEKVETRAVRGGTELVLTLAEGADARSGSADGAVYLNLYASAEQAPPQAAARQTVPVTAEATADKLSLAFRWDAPVGAAVFRRGEAVWIVFDTPARLDMGGAARLGPATKAHWTTGADHVVVRLAAPEALAVSAVADGSTWTVTVGGEPVGVEGVSIGRD